ncbi:MAG: DUF1365 domain-containing protein [Fimbriimonadaceae bacterium]
MHSAIFEGWVRHRRYVPSHHSFTYALYMMYLDLAELARADLPVLAECKGRFRRTDHLGDPTRPLEDCVRELVREQTGRSVRGPVRLLTHLRQGGYVMNPVCFYYCFGESGIELEAIVAEVHNTPWGEMHAYVLDSAEGQSVHQFAKAFHVSPFMKMAQQYVWRFNRPDKNLVVHMENQESAARVFDATLVLKRRPLTRSNVRLMSFRHPWSTRAVICRIYIQALKLWMKRVPVHPHPSRAKEFDK